MNNGKQKPMKAVAARRQPKEVTFRQFEEAMSRYADAEQREKEINQEMETDINELVLKYQDELSTLELGKMIAFGVVQAYCISNKQVLFSRRRSIGTVYGAAGFRLGKPQLKTVKGANWDVVLKELKKKLPTYVRNYEEPAKDLLLADRHNEHIAPLLAEIGVEVIQEELFYIETKKAA
jgi:phage host-nuclease inhibitor protein Gam